MDSPPPRPGHAGAPISMEQLVEKEREIAARATDLQRREREVQLALQRTLPNFPPKFLCIRPLVFHSIVSEVPRDRVRFVRLCYFNYYFTCFLLLFNFGVAIMGAAAADGSGPDFSWVAHVGSSVPHLFGIIGAFMVWYLPIYTSASKHTGYPTAFIGAGVGLLYAIFMTVGAVSFGGCGWLYASALLVGKASGTPFLVGAICAALWSTQVPAFLAILARLRSMRNEDSNSEVDATQRAARQTMEHNAVEPAA